MQVKPLYLTSPMANVPVSVPANTVKDLRNHHIMGIRFLYDCFRQNFNGAILNHDLDMNCQLQITAFINALQVQINLPVLIVCQEEAIPYWHYQLTRHGNCTLIVLAENNCKEILQDESIPVILASITDTKLIEKLADLNLFMVIVDEFDKVATKRAIKRAKGKFNIGLTTRNFLKHPDQKLFWTMLNWSNPGVLEKLANFYDKFQVKYTRRSDDNHYANLRNAYENWWQRLTWNFDEHFMQPTLKDKALYDELICDWARQNNLNTTWQTRCLNKSRKRKIYETPPKSENASPDKNFDSSIGDSLVWTSLKKHRKTRSNLCGDTSTASLKTSKISIDTGFSESDSSQDTIIMDVDASPPHTNVKNKPSGVDSDPILNSIIDNVENEQKLQCTFEETHHNLSNNENTTVSGDDILSTFFDTPNTSKASIKAKCKSDSDDDVLSSIISNRCTQKSKESRKNRSNFGGENESFTSNKFSHEEIFSEMFDEPVSIKQERDGGDKEGESDILSSLFDFK